MSVMWNCDICGKRTHVNPPTEQEFEDKEITTEVPESFIDPKTKKKKIVFKPITELKRVPKVGKAYRQDIFTGKVEEIDVPMQKDLFPRTVIVQLTVAGEMVQRDFCKDCFNKDVQPKVKKLWDELSKIESK